MGLQRYRGLWQTHNSFKIYICLVLLILASQRIEDMIGWEFNSNATKRGASPSLVESFILAWVAGKLYINSINFGNHHHWRPSRSSHRRPINFQQISLEKGG